MATETPQEFTARIERVTFGRKTQMVLTVTSTQEDVLVRLPSLRGSVLMFTAIEAQEALPFDEGEVGALCDPYTGEALAEAEELAAAEGQEPWDDPDYDEPEEAALSDIEDALFDEMTGEGEEVPPPMPAPAEDAPAESASVEPPDAPEGALAPDAATEPQGSASLPKRGAVLVWIADACALLPGGMIHQQHDGVHYTLAKSNSDLTLRIGSAPNADFTRKAITHILSKCGGVALGDIALGADKFSASVSLRELKQVGYPV
jgi:hypothetical protein